METAAPWVCVLLPLCLLPGLRCQTTANTTMPTTCQTHNRTLPPPTTSPPRSKFPIVTVQTSPGSMLAVKGRGAVKVEAVPTSVTVTQGGKATLKCRFEAPAGAEVTWRRACSRNFSEPMLVTNSSDPLHPVTITGGADVSHLVFHSIRQNDTGLYFCQVHTSEASDQSCGTYLRIRKPIPVPFLNMRESTKNQIITAEGVLLLLCAMGPGLFLLFRKRWENERLLQAKQSAYEEENLYEGLNLDECSMYEDISRGLQSTYQDVANIRVFDMQLEKP
ncbi:B-cell antigen receptor complex-associated protein alpha chain [Emydura macquarii macquarii]|uniref:B-cell antigen receptor complex-associated protein alpha chain n=1 Tax=Emydura macquarii macquarii TaxID=1129001 RepID=UPI003529EA4E